MSKRKSAKARRLRRDLDSYYVDAGANCHVRISVPKGAYVPTFQRRAEEDVSVADDRLCSEQGPSSNDIAQASLTGAARAKSLRHIRAAALAVVAAFVLAFAVWALLNGSKTSIVETTTREPAVLVMPFEALGMSDDTRFIAQGLTSELVSNLYRFPGFRLYSLTPGADDTQKLGVAYIVKGNVRSELADIQVAVQVIKPATDQIIWSKVYTRRPDREAMISVQSDVAAQIASAVGQPYGIVKTHMQSQPHAHAEGRTDDARAFYRQLKSNKRVVETSWETLVLRDFVRLRKAGYSNRLMNEIESHYAYEGWNTSVVNTRIAPPKLDGEEAVYVDMNPDELRSGDLLLKVDKPHEAMAAYLANLKKWSRNLEKQPDREDWKQHLAEAADRIVRTIDLLFRSGRFITALEYADQAVAVAPHLLSLQLARGCALVLLGQRDDQARSVFLQHRGSSIAGRSWDEAVRERFEDLRNSGCIRPLMEEIEHTFARTPELPSPAVAEGPNQRPRRIPKKLGTDVADIASGDDLFADGRLDDALTVYIRRLRYCESAFAGGRIK